MPAKVASWLSKLPSMSPSKRHLWFPDMSSIAIPALLVVWWVSNNVFAIDTDLLFQSHPSPLLFLDLTAVQTLFAFGLTGGYVAASEKTVSSAPGVTATVFAIAALHCVGTSLTNLSYKSVGSTSTLLWKLLEPIATLGLKHLVLRSSTSPVSVIGVLITLSGVLLFSKSAFTIPAFSPIILSNLVFPTRNILIKLHQRNSSDSPARRFLYMVALALPLTLLVLLPKIVWYGLDVATLWPMVRNALLFSAYHLSSFLLLQRLDPLTHSLLNTLKRFTGILVTILFITVPAYTYYHYEAIPVTIIGFLVYLAGDSKKVKLGGYGFAGGIVVGMAFMFVVGNSVRDLVNEKTEVPLIKPVEKIERLNVSAETLFVGNSEGQRSGYVIYTGKHSYRKHIMNVTYDSYEQLDRPENRPETNVGNLVWQYAAHKVLPDFSNSVVCAESIAECQEVASKHNMKIVQYLPMANMLNPTKPDMFTGTYQNLKSGKIDEAIPIGLGIQMSFRPNSSDPEFNLSAKISVRTDDYPAPVITKKFLGIMEERGAKMLLRGDFSLGVVQKEGFNGGHSVGCPSLWLNKNIHLGRTLEEKYKSLATRVGDRSLKVAINVKRVKGFVTQLRHFRDYYPNSRFYAQGMEDVNFLHENEVPFHRLRLFRNVEHWLNDLRDMDVSYGVRIHGNMAALGAGVPPIVVASDWRVLELVRRMGIPHFTTYDEVFSREVDVANLVKLRVGEFDGKKFDRNRCGIAKAYLRVFGKYRIEVKTHVQQISKLC